MRIVGSQPSRTKTMAAAVVRDWAELLPEILGSISERLPLIDYLRFGAVCSSWEAAAAVNLSRPPEMPYLLHVGIDGESCILVSLKDHRQHHITPLQEIRDKYFVGSQDGWLALLDVESEVSLFNPLTRAHIQLPSVTTIPGVDPVYNPDGSLKAFINHDDYDTHYTPARYRNLTFKKIVVSSRPTATSNYTVMAIFNGYCNHAVTAAAGGDKWTVLGDTGFQDIIYREEDNNFLLVSDTAELWAFDATAPSPLLRMLAAGIDGKEALRCYKFLVESAGDLLQVWIQASSFFNITSFKVMRFNPEQGAWVPLKSLGDSSLFLGACYSRSLSARDISELKPNCIYFTEILWNFLDSPKYQTMTRAVGVFNMEDGSFDRYSPSDPRLNWPPPLFFTPSLL